MSEHRATIDGIEIYWDTDHGRMQSINRWLVALWLDPSLLNILAPLRDELGAELFQLLVAFSSSQGTREDYETMVTKFATTFEEGFLAWGRAVGVVGWGRFELPAIDREAGTATVIVRSPWELVMQERLDEPWGCPFLRGKMIGIFRHALGANCWAHERCFEENGEHVLELSLFRSELTIEAELVRLRREMADEREQTLRGQVDDRTKLLRTSEERLIATLSSMASWVFTLDVGGDTERVLSSYRPRESSFPQVALGTPLGDVLPTAAASQVSEVARRAATTGRPAKASYDIADVDEERHYEATASQLESADASLVTVVVADVTERRRAEQERTHLEAQLRQAQKMEAIGRLTGGVAHDFNNLLTAIFGNLEIASDSGLSDEARECVDQAMAAARSAAELTHRLLAFSRQQPLQPNRVNPAGMVRGMEVLLRRTLGEHYELEIVSSAGQWECEIDETELERALLNLAINARDAMPDGGKITIETGNARISSEYALEVEGLRAGQYVVVAVSDTGSGMSEEVQARAYEPFFTTKGVGRGSGLGLSMVYGFVKQSNGHIQIYSELDVGTTIKLYLPRATTGSTVRPRAADLGTVPQGEGELVLVVEDDPPVRSVSCRFLKRLGYEVIDAATAEEALAIMDAHRIDVLFTDVVLPGGTNGAQLARMAVERQGHIAVLFASGYTENAIIHHGRLDEGIELVEKPFTRDQLGRRVYKVLRDKRTTDASD